MTKINSLLIIVSLMLFGCDSPPPQNTQRPRTDEPQNTQSAPAQGMSMLDHAAIAAVSGLAGGAAAGAGHAAVTHGLRSWSRRRNSASIMRSRR